ncbi:hypothetical protein KP509_33G053600 [Ceratopteris richardii]|uniref:P-type ATPase C-terminal domain-containing protein n=1 Tax=Ceratopteris richardii TaxID=49495 RepID=A0A8T2QP55_CERRI|nr:hypothetical protein KP509_33G053600 [Ceratopteris richardii]KAH7285975.1 hypothetical protein KP509_33G053600 [Ceratopteris richardii]
MQIKYFLYKNFVFGFSIFLFNAYTRFSGQSIYADWFLSLYNVVFTSAPVVVVAVMDQDLESKSRLQFPQLYKRGQLNSGNPMTHRIISWMLNGILQAAICYFCVIFGYGYGKIPDRSVGRMAGLFTIGTTMYTCVLFVVNFQIAILIQYWTWLHHFFIWGEIIVWFIFLLVFGAFPTKVSGELHRLFISITATSSSFYTVTLLSTVLALLPSFSVYCFLRVLYPSDSQIVQEREKLQGTEGFQIRSSAFPSRSELELASSHDGYPIVGSPMQGSLNTYDTFEAQARPLQNKDKQRSWHTDNNQESIGCNGIFEMTRSCSTQRRTSDMCYNDVK